MKEHYINVFKALSHRSRLRLLELLSENKELSVTELTKAMPREGSTVSRHLNELRLHGLVDVRQDRQNRLYSIEADRIKLVFKEFVEDLGIA